MYTTVGESCFVSQRREADWQLPSNPCINHLSRGGTHGDRRVGRSRVHEVCAQGGTRARGGDDARAVASPPRARALSSPEENSQKQRLSSVGPCWKKTILLQRHVHARRAPSSCAPKTDALSSAKTLEQFLPKKTLAEFPRRGPRGWRRSSRKAIYVLPALRAGVCVRSVCAACARAPRQSPSPALATRTCWIDIVAHFFWGKEVGL